MPKVAVYNLQGEQIGERELNEEIFGAPVNEALLHQVVVGYLANQRQGTADTKTRGEVRGGGRKPWRQKGTGRARQGSIRSPLWPKGGIVFGPHPRDYRQELPVRVRRTALVSALSAKVRDGELVVLDGVALDKPKTRVIAGLVDRLQAKRAMIVTPATDRTVYLSARNIPGVLVRPAVDLNAYDVLSHGKIMLVSEAVDRLEEVLANGGA